MKPQELKELREAHSLTPIKAAALVGVSAQAWRRWETGAHRMPPGVLKLLKRRLVGEPHTWSTPLGGLELKAYRLGLELSAQRCAEIVCVSPYTWRSWEQVGGGGARSMPPWAWDLFTVCTRGLAIVAALPLRPGEVPGRAAPARWPGSIG